MTSKSPSVLQPSVTEIHHNRSKVHGINAPIEEYYDQEPIFNNNNEQYLVSLVGKLTRLRVGDSFILFIFSIGLNTQQQNKHIQ